MGGLGAQMPSALLNSCICTCSSLLYKTCSEQQAGSDCVVSGRCKVKDFFLGTEKYQMTVCLTCNRLCEQPRGLMNTSHKAAPRQIMQCRPTPIIAEGTLHNISEHSRAPTCARASPSLHPHSAGPTPSQPKGASEVLVSSQGHRLPARQPLTHCRSAGSPQAQ